MPTTTKTVSSDNLARFKQKCDGTYASKDEIPNVPAIPNPTTSDNGKVLGVANGAYALQEAGGGGGGVLYRHMVNCGLPELGGIVVEFSFLSSNPTPLTNFSQIQDEIFLYNNIVVWKYDPRSSSLQSINLEPAYSASSEGIKKYTGSTNYTYYTANQIPINSDTVTPL